MSVVDPDWRAQLRAKGYRLTPQRELILQAVQDLGHATPEQVFAEVQRHSAAVNLSTVYRTLEVLQDLGLIRHTHLVGKAPTYHSIGPHEHFHLVCRNCERVISVDADVAGDFAALLARDFGFVADVGHLAVFGQCATCPTPDEED